MADREKLSMTALSNANAELVLENADLRKKVARLEAALKKHSPGFTSDPPKREFRTSFQGSVVFGSAGINQGRPSYDLIAPNGYIRKVICENDDVAEVLENEADAHRNFICEIRPTGMWVKGVGTETARFTMDCGDPNVDRHADTKKHFAFTEKGVRLKIVSDPDDEIDACSPGSEITLQGTFVPIQYNGKYYTQFFTERVLDANLSRSADADTEISF